MRRSRLFNSAAISCAGAEPAPALERVHAGLLLLEIPLLRACTTKAVRGLGFGV